MKSKKILFTAASLFIGTVNAQSSTTTVEVYGLLDTGVDYVDKVGGTATTPPGSLWAVHPGAMQASRMGYRGQEDLGGGVKAMFVLESGLNVDVGTFAQSGAAFGRRSVVGIISPMGTVTVGRQTDFLDDMGTLSSTIDFGSQAAPIHGLDRTYAERTNNSIKYTTPTKNGFTANAMYGFGENVNNSSQGQALAYGVNYQDGNLRLAGGYYQSALGATSADAGASKIGATKGNPGDVALKTYTLGAAYQLNAVRIHGTYSNTEQPLAIAGTSRSMVGASAKEVKIFDIGASWAITPALNINTSFIHDKVNFVGSSSGSLNQFNIGMDYYLSKRTDIYMNHGYQTANNMWSPGLSQGAPGLDLSQRLYRVGIRHKF